MAKVWLTTKYQGGFSAVEVLLAATIFAFLVTGLTGAIIYGRTATADSGDHARANFLAEEGLEAVRNIGTASYANLIDSATTYGNTSIESGSDFNTDGMSAARITTSTSAGTVSSLSINIKYVDASAPNIQLAVYADSSGSPGARLGATTAQAAVLGWNTINISGVTLSANTSYWLAISQDGNTQFANASSGGTAAYRVSGGYPAPATFAADTGNTSDKISIYASIASSSTYGLAKSGGQWTLSGTSDVTNIYTRQISIAADGSNRKLITSTVTWPQQGGSMGSVTLTTKLTNWMAALPIQNLWANARIAGSADATGTTDGLKIATAGNFAYIVRNGTTNNFIIVNISNPAAPSIVSTTTVSGTPTNIFVNGSLAYITTSTATSALHIINVATPSAPSTVRTVSMTGTAAARDVFVSGNYAYVARASSTTTGSNEFTVVNVTTPASASVVGGYNPNIQMNEIYVSGNYAYVATSSTTQEMVVVNITTPTSPTLAATYNPTTTVAATTINGFGNTIYLGMSTTLDAVNIATPTSPARLGTYTAAGTITDIDVDGSGQYVFIGTSSTTAEMQIINASTPSSLVLAKTINATGATSTVNGVAYNSSLDIVVGASASDTQEIITVTKN